MYRSILVVAALLASSAAQSAPPEIAYATAGQRGDTIYLVNSTGMGLTKQYQGRASSRGGAPIHDIALRSYSEASGGGEVAFIEDYRALKIIKHDENGQPDPNGFDLVAVPNPNCILHDLDYLENGTLIIATTCDLLELAPGERTATAIIGSPYVQSLTAIGNSLLYVESTGGLQADLKRLDGTTITVVRSSLNAPFFGLDASPANSATPATAFLSDKQTFQTVGLTSPYLVAGGCTTGSEGGWVEVSPNGSEMLYLYRNQMFVHASNCSGRVQSRLARGVRSFAWRTY